jgi:hypothetical protein
MKMLDRLDQQVWSTELSRPLILNDGTNLVTFMDAVKALIQNFAGSPLAGLEHTIDLLVKAHTSQEAADIEAASEQMERLLRERGLMK